jgi:hypothetical protein
MTHDLFDRCLAGPPTPLPAHPASGNRRSLCGAGRRSPDELQDQGDLDVNGLNSSEPLVLKELVRNLFLFCYARALRPT